ncbi:MAG: BREX-2 system phosphatase PglZ, partial [Acidimicrobiales bacterium]
ADIVPLGLVAGVIHDRAADDVAAAVRLDERLHRPGLAADAYRSWAAAAEDLVRGADDPASGAGYLDAATGWLRTLGADALAGLSDLLPTGFDQRMRDTTVALAAWRAHPDDADRAAAAEAALVRVVGHRTGQQRAPERIARVRMATRLLRRGSLSLELTADLEADGLAYARDGAWLDAARTVVSRGDPDPELAGVLSVITADADRYRVDDGRRFAAAVAASAATAVPAQLVGVESVLDRVVVLVAQVKPLLLVVMDGMGWPTFTEFVGGIEAQGWTPWRRDAPDWPATVAVAALPTVTEVSRTSLFAGRLRSGDQESERRAFAAHDGLRTVTGSGPPPELYHKRDLRAGGLDTLPAGVLDAVADERRRVVGVVLNNIDERLKDVAQPADGWELRDLDPLRYLLDEARRAGRAVILTADHGHVLDRDAPAGIGGGGGERWRLPDPPAGEGELLVTGPRVVAEGNRVVLPWHEQLRYGSRRNGYHGGLTPRELLVPLIVLCADDLPADDLWAPVAIRRPEWWDPPGAVRLAPVRAPVRVPVPDEPPTLFDQPPAAVPAAEPLPGWVEGLVASPTFVTRRHGNARVRLTDDVLVRLLAALDATGGMAASLDRVARAADLPPARIDRYLAQLQLVNVDGYGVLTVVNGEVRFDRVLLQRQFGL